MKTGIIIEARTTSTRLPQKVLKEILPGKSLIECLIERLKPSDVNEIILATTTNQEDNLLCELAQKMGIKFFRGSEEDVLERVYLAAKQHSIDTIVEVTADNPLIEAQLVNEFIQKYKESYPTYDFVGNPQRTYPLGIVVYVFAYQALEKIYLNSTDPEDREHVSLSLYTTDQFKALNIEAPEALHHPDWRLTVDTEEDLELIKIIFKKLSVNNNPVFYLIDVVDFLIKNPNLLAINQNIQQKQTKRTGS